MDAKFEKKEHIKNQREAFTGKGSLLYLFLILLNMLITNY